MALEDRVKAQVSVQLSRYGEAVTIRTINTTYDPATGRRSGAAPTDETVYAGVSNYAVSELGDLIEAGDLKVVIENNGVTPEISNTIIIGGAEYNIISIEPIRFKAQIMAYVIQARK